MRVISLVPFIGAAIALPTEAPGASPANNITAPDVNAIKAVPQNHFKSYQTGGLVRQSLKPEGSKSKRDWVCSTSPTLTWGDGDNGGKGIFITNTDNDWRGFYAFHNNCDTIPYKYIWVAAGATQFVSFPDGWEGRIQRGVDATMLNGQAHWLGTWFEFSWDANGWGWSDVSLIRGCDGPVLVSSQDGSGAWKGFTQDILSNAPSNALDTKDDGQRVLAATEFIGGAINTPPRDWELQQVGSQYVYVDDSHGSPVIAATNGRFGTTWPAGRP
ncbi:uncharacterized protein Triagg1_10194 [Trichoderma aggressivum f. europaeum]|uniref:Uncharacterized protein n=1 Tax=Trichoderma aggressivum f. europaeum TaxID=173218 RepID=A0AAE1LVX4_9HYPO|nr:hypothetical protein Triagg1_10194 [Trichoderma aggressivum f. europaeum]